MLLVISPLHPRVRRWSGETTWERPLHPSPTHLAPQAVRDKQVAAGQFGAVRRVLDQAFVGFREVVQQPRAARKPRFVA